MLVWLLVLLLLFSLIYVVYYIDYSPCNKTKQTTKHHYTLKL